MSRAVASGQRREPSSVDTTRMVGVLVELPTFSCTVFLIAQDLKFSKLELMQRSPMISSTSYVSMQMSL
eukprot:8652795-Pyramimonas_sp.AAC.1